MINLYKENIDLKKKIKELELANKTLSIDITIFKNMNTEMRTQNEQLLKKIMEQDKVIYELDQMNTTNKENYNASIISIYRDSQSKLIELAKNKHNKETKISENIEDFQTKIDNLLV